MKLQTLIPSKYYTKKYDNNLDYKVSQWFCNYHNGFVILVAEVYES